ncbi:MAG: hypothetical protein L0H70_09665, partial [Xanthomonadales bacterium]|nr:hypothetical protein [Xanthomonadales bacterium]
YGDSAISLSKVSTAQAPSRLQTKKYPDPSSDLCPGTAFHIAAFAASEFSLERHAAEHVTDFLQALLQRRQLGARLMLSGMIADVFNLHFQTRHLDHQVMTYEQRIDANGGGIHLGNLLGVVVLVCSYAACVPTTINCDVADNYYPRALTLYVHECPTVTDHCSDM